MSKNVRFEPRQPTMRFSDFARMLVLGGLGGFVYLNQADLERLGPTGPSSPDQPWIVSPALGEAVSAGKVKFQGTGPAGARVEVVENKRVVGEGWVKDGKWTIEGKMFKSGPTAVRARVVKDKGMVSPSRHLTISGSAEQTLTISSPHEGGYIQAGKITLNGRGKPGDKLTVFYNNIVIADTMANKDGQWKKVVKISEPKKEASFKVTSKSEAEIAVVLVRGNN